MVKQASRGAFRARTLEALKHRRGHPPAQSRVSFSRGHGLAGEQCFDYSKKRIEASVLFCLVKKMEKLFNYIENNQEKYLDLWERICNIEAKAEHIAELNAIADSVAEFAIALGFSAKRIKNTGCGDFLVIDSNPGGEKGVAFLAHTDTVHAKGAFGNPPVKIVGGKISGPGVIDCKGGIPIALLAMKALSESGFSRNNRLVLTTDEEVSNSLGGEHELEFIRSSVSGYAAAFNCEVGKENQVVVSRKGILRVRFEITGRASHSGIDYFSGASALREAAYKIIALEQQSTQGGTTFNCSLIKGGATANIVPDYCEFAVDIRVRDHSAMEQAERTVEEIAGKCFVEGTTAKILPISRRAPMLRNGATEGLFNHMNAVSKRYSLGELTPVESGGGSDSAYTQQANVPSVCAVGAFGDFCHTVNEFAYISSLAKQAKLLAASAKELF